MSRNSDWKTTLYKYIRTCNRFEIDDEVRALSDFVADGAFLQKQRVRQRNRAIQRARRQIEPIRSETGLRLLNIREHPHQVQLEIGLRRKLDYFKHQVVHSEEKVERERITMDLRQGEWRMIHVEPAVPELQSVQRQSLPYLNDELFWKSVSGFGHRAIEYNRLKAQQYADRWWDQANPAYLEFPVNCTNYVSQCLFAGDAPMNYTGRRESGWWYKGKSGPSEHWSFSWAVAHSLQQFLKNSRSGLRATLVESPEQLTIGDVIIYDWNGDGKFQHSTIVTELDGDGMPLVNANTNSSKHRYWDYRDSYAWSEQTQYRFFHIADRF